jgi:hypothetical protein
LDGIPSEVLCILAVRHRESVLLAIFLLSMLVLRLILWHNARKLRKLPSADLSGSPLKTGLPFKAGLPIQNGAAPDDRTRSGEVNIGNGSGSNPSGCSASDAPTQPMSARSTPA